MSGGAAAGEAWAAMAIVAMAVTACGGSKSDGVKGGGGAATAPLPGIVAHRGASGEAPENTVAALKLAWELGVESSEIDIRLTRDRAVVLLHDATTARTGGLDRPIEALTLEEARQLDVGGWKDARYAGERIPTLGEALDATPPGRMLFVEIKTGPADAEVIAAAIVAADPRRRGAALALQAYDPDAMAAVAARVPGLETFWAVDPERDGAGGFRPYTTAVVDAARARGFTGLALDHRALDAETAKAVQAAGLQLDVWTVNDRALIQTWRARGARWIETDRPALAR